MTSLSAVAGAVGRGGFNVAVNAAAAFSASNIIYNDLCTNQCIAMIVAIDTIFRIAITHALDAFKIPFLEKGTAGHLLWPCLTLLTLPLSSKIARRFFNTGPDLSKKIGYIEMFGFTALSWKVNMMLKDVIYLAGLERRKL